ncbi:FG-GAP repeat domain-containing protein [Streptomyces sp. NRRL F-5727]|uniref:FG-GAP repeat domain-containing protein n=1 Tax=Streptomyces sp. NRRL F-5727 TaxID=1463871 RepID=UPI0004C696FA|nr:VCBS repeat-containing protein [Streptomyces sp. NRRL F-5727]
MKMMSKRVRALVLAAAVAAPMLGVTGTTTAAHAATSGATSIVGRPDLTGDGRAELISKGDQFYAFRNASGHTWGWPWDGSTSFGAGEGWGGVDGRGVYFADMDADGFKERIQKYGDGFRGWHNAERGWTSNPFPATFTTGTSGWSGVNAADVWFADINGDNQADLIQKVGSYLRYFPNRGGGNSWGGAISLGVANVSDPNRIHFADLDGDGDAELIEHTGTSFYVSPNTHAAGGGFPWPGEYDHTTGSGWEGVDPNNVWFADITGDGQADIVQRNGDALQYYPNTGKGKGWAGARGCGTGWQYTDPNNIYFV